MKWFSRDWAEGRLTEAQVEYVQDDYAAHVAGLRTQAPDLADLLDLDLHDGQVREWALAENGFRWRLLVGDLQRGYEHATIDYDGAQVVGGPAELEALGLDSPDLEVLYDEVDAAPNGRHLHRVLLWPEGELWLHFDSVRVTRSPATPNDRR